MAIIEVTNLSKAFQETTALDGMTFTIASGEIFGFLGPSGAGKTTVINILTNQLSQDKGSVHIFGKTPNQLQSEDFKKIGIMSDSVGFYEKMTVYNNLAFFARFHKAPLHRVDTLLKQLDLYDARDKKADKLSTGQRQRLLLIRAILHEPDLLFLDEPTSGMDPTLSLKVHNLLLDLKKKGVAIFLTTHDMQEATSICDTISLLHRGKILEYGSPTAIIDKHRTSDKVYLRYRNGREKIVDSNELAEHLSSEVISMRTLEPTLESIFITLTGEEWHE